VIAKFCVQLGMVSIIHCDESESLRSHVTWTSDMGFLFSSEGAKEQNSTSVRVNQCYVWFYSILRILLPTLFTHKKLLLEKIRSVHRPRPPLRVCILSRYKAKFNTTSLKLCHHAACSSLSMAKEFFLTLNETTSLTQEKYFAPAVLVIKIQFLFSPILL